MKNKVVVLMGATGVGKTDTSIRLAKYFDMEIISADSVQVFKEFDIGSAKIAENEMSGIKHYGIDIVSADREFTVSDFVDYTNQKIEEILSKGKTPLIVGGTGLYVKALIEGYNFGGTAKQAEFRQEMEKIADENGEQALYEKLQLLDSNVAEKIDKKNRVRLIRALEIATFGNKKRKEKNNKYDFKIIALDLPRDILYERINKRCEKMFEMGLTKEVATLYSKYGECQPMRAIGYKEVVSYLKGEIDKEQLLLLISQHTRNYAKRQLTFMRAMENIEYYDLTSENFLDIIKESIEKWIK